MDTFQIPAEHLPSVLFSLGNEKARKASSKMSLLSVSLDSLLASIKSVVVYDKDVQDLRVSYCMKINYNHFRRKYDIYEVANRQCIE